MDLPTSIVNGFERVRSVDAARVLGIPTSDRTWGSEVAARMRSAGFDGPKVMSFGDGIGRGYERPRRIPPEEFLSQFAERDDAIGAMARAALQAPSDLNAVAVGAMARLSDQK